MNEVTEKEEYYRRKIYSVATDNNKLLLSKLWDGKFDILMKKNYFRIFMLYVIQPSIFLLLYFSLDNNFKYLRTIAKTLIIIDMIYIFIISIGVLYLFNRFTHITISQAVLYYREISPKPFFRIDTIIKVLIITALYSLGNNVIASLLILSILILESSSARLPEHLYKLAQKDFTKDQSNDATN